MALRIALLLLLGLFCAPGWSQTPPKLELRSTDQDATVMVNGRPALRFFDTGMGLSPQERGKLVIQRLRLLMAKGISPKQIVVKQGVEGVAIVAPNLRILDVTPADALVRNISVLTLARTWVANLQSFLSQPGLGFSVPRLTIPIGQSRSAQVVGVAEGTVEITAQPEGLVQLQIDAEREAVIATGVNTGSGVIVARLGDTQVELPFDVKKAAGVIGSAVVQITGDGPSDVTLRRMVQRAALNAIYSEPGAQVRLGALQLARGSTRVGPGARASLPVSIEGSGFLPVKGTVEVTVQRETVVSGEPENLFYSNNPEMLRRYGSLFIGHLVQGQCTRLLYHHQNIMGKGVAFVTDLFNRSQQAVKLHVIEAVADPQVDTFQIGHRATAKFLPSYFGNDGYILELQPGERYTLVRQRLSHNQTASGIFQFRQLTEGSVYVQCRADDPSWSVSPSLPPTPRTSEEVFPSPQKVIDASYEVGGKWAFIGIGKQAIKDAHGNRRLDGNYGVLYEIRLKLANPKPIAQPVSILFEPSAGLARGVFYVDNELVEAAHLRPPTEFPLKTYTLRAGETRDVVIRTMPLAGSNYPATIIARVGTTIAQR